MSTSELPEHASLEYLKKLAKERLQQLRTVEPATKLAEAQRAVARDHGFPSWRALKTECDRRRGSIVASFFDACQSGDEAFVRDRVTADARLVRERNEEGSTALHVAVAHPAVVRVLLDHGAEPNVRDRGDNALPLHFAAGGGYLETVRALLDAGSDVHGVGDLHEAEVIGWAACLHEPQREVVALLLERGARHHIFSAMAMNDPDLVRRVVEDDPTALRRRRSRFESGQTPLHFALFPPDGFGPRPGLPQYEMMDLLLSLGADLEAVDGKGRTVLALAMLRGERETIRRLRAAGAKEPTVDKLDVSSPALAALGRSVRRLTPMLGVTDVGNSVAWYTAIGFRLAGRNEHDGVLDWASLTFGQSEIMLTLRGSEGPKPVTLWFFTDRLDELYGALKARQLRAVQGASGAEPEIRFEQDLYEAFYGMREFSIKDPDDYILAFAQPMGE